MNIFYLIYCFFFTCPCDYGFSGKRCKDECGLTFNPPNVRVFGGIPAVKNSWPSMTFTIMNYTVITKNANGTTTYGPQINNACGGSLIDRTTILTAAHCFPESFPMGTYRIPLVPNELFPTRESFYTVFLGAHDFTTLMMTNDIKNGNAYPAKRVKIAKIIVHPGYVASQNYNDIAIIKLAEEVELNNNVQLACLPNPEINPYPAQDNIPSYLVGWGATSNNHGGMFSPILNNVNLTIYPGSYCAASSPNKTKHWEAQICAGEMAGGKDACLGDSGGPLFVDDHINGKLKKIVSGLVSYGDDILCGKAGAPGVYTRVSYYMDWITANRK